MTFHPHGDLHRPCCHGDDPPPEVMSLTRAHAGHMAVRFGDNRPTVRVLLDGVDVTDRCVELVTGTEGWVELHQFDESGDLVVHGVAAHPDGHVASQIRRGRVEVTQ